MFAEFITPNDIRWREALARIDHDIYHTPEYLSHASKFEGGSPTCFVAELNGSLLIVPLLIRSVPAQLDAPDNWRDATSPYGYPGPLLSPNTGHETARAMFDLFLESATREGIICAFLRMHPFFPIHAASLPDGVLTTLHGETIYIDLLMTADELTSQVRENHRRNIRRLVKDGFHVVMNEWSLFGQFINLYSQTMHRASAAEFYFFSDAYFEEMRERLNGKLHLGCVLSPSGDVASAALFTETCGLLQYHLSGTAEEFVGPAPLKLLLNHMRDWAKNRGNRRYHLGGGLGGKEDSLFRYKAGFSKLRAEFSTARIVFDQQSYAALNRRRANCHPDTEPPTSFFPVYRYAA